MKTCFVFVALLLLGGCFQRSALENTLIDMNERLVSFTGIDNPIDINKPELSAPSKQTFKLNVDEVLINLREFYSLDECQVTKLVAERNTALGKTQLPSVRFAYERAMLTALQNCSDQIDPSHRMQNKLNEWMVTKQENLPVVYANLITQSTESYNAISLPSGYIQGSSADHFPESKLAINALVNAPTNDALDLSELENHLKALENARLVANMWHTQNLFIEALPQITPLLQKYQTANTCETRAQRDELKIMQNIFKLFFADKIQPLASQLNKYHYQIGPLLNELTSMPSLPDAYIAYVSEHNNDKHAQYRQVMSEHIQAWQKIFKLCS